MILYYSKTLFFVSLIFFIPLILFNIHFSKQLSLVTHQINTNLEAQADVIQMSSTDEMRAYFNFNRTLRIRASNLDVFNFAKMESLNIVVIILAIFLILASSLRTPGDIYSVIAYTLRYTGGFDVLPQLIDKMVFIKDLQKRLAIV